MMERMKKHPKKTARESYFWTEEDREFNLESMRKYLQERPEMDKQLEKMIAPCIAGGGNVLDPCGGIGPLTIHLHEKFPNAAFLGVDETPYLIDEARKLAANVKNVRFEVDDLYSLPEKFRKAFDVSICWKTLSWLPGYEEALRALVAITRAHMFISSLFYDGDIDYEIQV